MVAVMAAELVYVPLLGGAQSLAGGFARVGASVVKVWALDARGIPIASGTGFIVDSGNDGTTVLTATHVVKGAVSIRVDLDRTVHDLVATVIASNPYDMTILNLSRGNLKAVHFATRPVSVGDPVAIAGFFRSDEAGGEILHLVSPGTVSAMVRDGTLLEFDDLGVRDGLGGGPLFDPVSGNVLGMVSTRTADGRGGFAVAARPILVAFLDAQHIRLAAAAPLLATPLPTASPVPAPAPTITTTKAPAAIPVATPRPAASSAIAVVAVSNASGLPARAAHSPPVAESWMPFEGLPGMYWLWTSAGYADGYQSIDLFLTNDYVKAIFFYPEIRLTLEGKPYTFYFNEKRTFNVAAASARAFRLRFSLPLPVQSLFVSMHEVRFGTDDGPMLFAR
jgi:hypothetical protein